GIEVLGGVSTQAMVSRVVTNVRPDAVVVSHGELHGLLPRRVEGVPVVRMPDAAGADPADLDRWARAGVRIVRERAGGSRRPARSEDRPRRAKHESVPHPVVLVGASTGGPQILEAILRAMPDTVPPFVIAQHMPAHQTARLAERLDQVCRIRVREARDGVSIAPGEAWIAPGGRHLAGARQGRSIVLRTSDDPLVNGHRPSVDVLFDSVARMGPAGALAMVLTGMGSDGATGLLQLRQGGALTLVQNEATATVYGMPRVAWERGGAERQQGPRGLIQSVLNYASR
ncbi:MAG: CheB methylesterase domain-containing protein, partial [Myxococcota bacterium]